MKNIYIILFLFLSIVIGCGNNSELKIINENAYSPNIDGFMGIKWGESLISAKQNIVSREESPKIDWSTPFNFSVKNIKLGDRILKDNIKDNVVDSTYEYCIFMFCSKGFYLGGCHMYDESEDFPIKLKSLIIEKHGQPWKGNNKGTYFQWRSRDNNIINLNWFFSDRKYVTIISYHNVTREDECKALNEEAKYEAARKKIEQEKLQKEEMEKKKHIQKDF